MSAPATQPATDPAEGLFDRYTLPKIALAVILAASLVGTWVTTALSGHAGMVQTFGKWAYFVALGVLTGGLLWKHGFVRPADLGTGAAEYCEAMYDRFDRIAAIALLVLVGGAVPVIREYVEAFGPTPPLFALGALFLTWIAMVVVTTYSRGAVEEQFRSRAGLATLGLAIAVVVATAVAEVALRGLTPDAVAVRILHLLAFAVWIGGAVWNIFVAVPTGQERPTVPVVRAAGEQLERFRWAVRFIIPTLLLTGLYQAAEGLGTSLGTYVGSVLGLAVLAKVGFIGLLVTIFLLCPMWRACSPIEGVCDLEELGGQSASDGTAGGTSEVTDGD